MKPENIIKALRCSATPGEHDCDGCPYLVIEKLSREEAEIFGTSELESCDCDKIALDATELLEAYHATNHAPEECAAAFEGLAAYRAAEQDGTLLRLPCKVGDMVFVDKRTLFERWRTKGVSEDIATGKVVSFRKNKTSTFVKIKFYFKEGSRTYFENYVLSAFGKTVFLTRESAEAALKEQEANQ